MREKMEINKKIRGFVNENLTIVNEEIEFADTDDIFELGFVNSLFAMKLLTYIESEFVITVENDEMDLTNFNSISNIVSYVSSKLQSV